MSLDPSLGSRPLGPRLFLNRSICAASKLCRWMFIVQRQRWLSRASPLQAPSLQCRSSLMGAFLWHCSQSSRPLSSPPLETHCTPSGLICASLGSSAASWNRRGGDAVRLCVDSFDDVRVVSLSCVHLSHVPVRVSVERAPRLRLCLSCLCVKICTEPFRIAGGRQQQSHRDPFWHCFFF